jgi:ABC-type glycerol-3-phosphate transport system substrate-binding protein
MMRRVLSVLAVATAAFVLAACGGDDDNDSATATTSTPPATGITPPTYTGSSDSEFCRLGRENNDRLQEITGAFGDPTALARLLQESAPEVRKAAEVAPPEIKNDVTVLADGFETLLQSLESGQPDTSVILDPRFQVAATNLNAYARQVCGITG